MSDQKYKIKYTLDIETGEFTPDDLGDREMEGLTDQLVVVSIVKEKLDDEGESVSVMISDFSGDSENARVTSDDMFVVWLALADGLKNKEDLEPAARNVARMSGDLAKMLVFNQGKLKEVFEEARLEMLTELSKLEGEPN